MLADAVIPISYAFRSHPDLSQHSWTLFSYKSRSTRSREDGSRLTDLLTAFLSLHAQCITRVLGGRPNWYTIVPSSQGRTDHPLRTVANIPSLDRLDSTIRSGYSAQRSPRLFELGAINPLQAKLSGESVLIVDDTWVTGNTAQSLAYQLKCAGASAVVILTLGRWADFREPMWRQLIERSVAADFDVDTCAIEDFGQPPQSRLQAVAADDEDRDVVARGLR
jgi:hypothetical protein